MARKAAPKPDNWDEMMNMVDRGEMTLAQAAEELGMSVSWICRLRHREHPGRQNRRAETMRRVAKANRRHTTPLERDFSDYLMCKAIKAIDKCDRCPKRCNGQKQYRGLIKALMQKVPLNADENILEEDK